MAEKITCDGCGACCKLMLVRFRGSLPADYCKAREIKTVGSEFIAFSNPCPQFKDGKCSIYPNRPKMCASFAVGSLDCLLCRRLIGIDAGKKEGVGGDFAPAPRLSTD